MKFRIYTEIYKSLFLGGILAFILFAPTGCGTKQTQNPANPAEIPKTEVVVDKVGQEDVQLYMYVEGRTVPYKLVDIRVRVAGYLEQLFFKAGDIVKAGDRLALIEQDQFQVGLDAAKAELALNEAKAALAKSNLDRAKQLIDSVTISIEEFQSRQAEFQTAQASVELAKTSVRRAELDLQYTDLRSPITGKGSKNLVDIGNYVSPTGNQSVIMSIAQLDPIYVDFFISDRQFIAMKEALGFREKFDEALKLFTEEELNRTNNAENKNPENKETDSENKELEIQLPQKNDSENEQRGTFEVALSTGTDVLSADFSLKGKIIALVDNRITLETGQITLRGELRNPLLHINGRDDYMIYPGQICRVRIPYEQVKNAILIREKAIQTDLDTKYILIVEKGMYTPTDRFNRPLKDKNGDPVPAYETYLVKRRDIKIGRLLDSQMRIVLEGLNAGETYIVEGLQRTRIGMEVAPITLEEYNKRRLAETSSTESVTKETLTKETTSDKTTTDTVKKEEPETTIKQTEVPKESPQTDTISEPQENNPSPQVQP
ncbi:MAG: efflux RND transporter periplasmic adaptor subunit [Planctomycetaceae bacterium]|jgi:RND family efflux transporter MFP subunit|nr:efflux RND transporter periplasmic adaptor subunit [Planctomycetaceae bacterium]